jgi:hypothetical protein
MTPIKHQKNQAQTLTPKILEPFEKTNALRSHTRVTRATKLGVGPISRSPPHGSGTPAGGSTCREVRSGLLDVHRHNH